eukprot:2742508-Pleurochrysis_carterae.AAC.1
MSKRMTPCPSMILMTPLESYIMDLAPIIDEFPPVPHYDKRGRRREKQASYCPLYACLACRHQGRIRSAYQCTWTQCDRSRRYLKQTQRQALYSNPRQSARNDICIIITVVVAC